LWTIQRMSSIADWHPVLAAGELRAGQTIVAARVLGQDLALWRSAAGQVQAWEDRCPHRGVALSLGRIAGGDRLACAYHGWEYAAGSGRCVVIPALPDLPVPGKVGVTTFATQERQGMVWVHSKAPSGNDPPPATLAAPALFLRSMAVNADVATVAAVLAGRGFHQLAPWQWSGPLADQTVQAFTLAATPALCLLHLACVNHPRPQGLPALFGAARLLRSAIETGAS